MGQDVDIGEVPRGCPVKESQQLVAGEFFRGECRTGCRLGRGEVWRRVHGQVDYDCAITVPDDQPTECAAVVDPLGAPAPRPGCSLQGVAGCRYVSRFRSGEEVEILGRSGVRCCATRAAPPASRSPYSRAGRRTAWRPPSGKQSAPASRQPWPRPQDLLPPSRRGPAGGLDHRGPRRSDRSRKHQLIPEVEQQGAVNVGQDVGWTSFLEHDLVHTSTVGA